MAKSNYLKADEIIEGDGEVHYLVPSDNEFIKSRKFAKPNAPLNRTQAVAFSVMGANAYSQLLNNPNTVKFTIDTDLLKDKMGITHNNIFKKYRENSKNSHSITLEDALYVLRHVDIEFEYKDEKGETRKKSTGILGEFDLGLFETFYTFQEWMRENILTAGNAYILKLPVLSKLRSEYAVALYDYIEYKKIKRNGITKKVYDERISLSDFKQMIGAIKIVKVKNEKGEEESKLAELYDRWDNLKSRVIDPAVTEINEIVPYVKIEILPDLKRKMGRKITHVYLHWTISDEKEKESEKIAYIRNYEDNFPEFQFSIPNEVNKDVEVKIYFGKLFTIYPKRHVIKLMKEATNLYETWSKDKPFNYLPYCKGKEKVFFKKEYEKELNLQAEEDRKRREEEFKKVQENKDKEYSKTMDSIFKELQKTQQDKIIKEVEDELKKSAFASKFKIESNSPIYKEMRRKYTMIFIKENKK